MKLNVGTKIVSGYIIFMVIFVFLAVLYLMSINGLLESQTAVKLTVDEREAMDHINFHLSEAESDLLYTLFVDGAGGMQAYNKSISELTANMSLLKTLSGGNTMISPLVSDLENSILPMVAIFDKIVTIEGDRADYASLIKAELFQVDTLHEPYLTAMNTLNSELVRLDEMRRATLTSRTSLTKLIIYLSLPLMVVLIILITLSLIRSIVVPLKEAIAVADRIAEGDLMGSISKTDRRDEIGLLLSSFDRMVIGLRQTTKELTEGINVLSSSTVEIMSSTSQISLGAVETASAISETSSTVEEVRQGAQFASEKSKLVSEVTQQAVQISDKGLSSVEMSIEGMNKIKNQVEFIAESLVELSEQSQAIGEIINSVNDLAEQSNLLAVNASIEAAKAGEHGKGFSVVAQEVKILAEQSKEATSQVRKILNDILKATNTAVMSTEKGNDAVQMGVQQSKDASEAIRMMVEQISKANQSAIQINVTNQQQLTGMKQINEAMENIQGASNHNLDGNKQVEESLQNLQNLSHKLKKVVDTFKL